MSGNIIYQPQESAETIEWWSLTPAERWLESSKLWSVYLALGGSLEPEPDSQSPFYDPEAPVRALLMGGQACILYGAAEFSRDVDLAVLADEKNLERLRRALDDLAAEPVYFPELSESALSRGHACHFRVSDEEAAGLRLDVMSVMRGCGSFDELWTRRRRIRLPGNGVINVLSLPDLVRAKKAQRDKDWPMIRRLVESDYHNRPKRPSKNQIDFWLREARTESLLLELCKRYNSAASRLAPDRQAVRWAILEKLDELTAALKEEEARERKADEAYWGPLKEELSRLRSQRPRS